MNSAPLLFMDDVLLERIKNWVINNPEEAPRGQILIQQLERIKAEFEGPMRDELIQVVAETFDRHQQLTVLHRWSVEVAENVSNDLEQLSTLLRECRVRATTMLGSIQHAERRIRRRSNRPFEIN